MYLDSMILACTCLHNYIRENDELENLELPSNSILQDIRSVDYHTMTNAMVIRETFKSYFISEHGAVPWQNEMIGRC